MASSKRIRVPYDAESIIAFMDGLPSDDSDSDFDGFEEDLDNVETENGIASCSMDEPHLNSSLQNYCTGPSPADLTSSLQNSGSSSSTGPSPADQTSSLQNSSIGPSPAADLTSSLQNSGSLSSIGPSPGSGEATSNEGQCSYMQQTNIILLNK